MPIYMSAKRFSTKHAKVTIAAASTRESSLPGMSALLRARVKSPKNSPASFLRSMPAVRRVILSPSSPCRKKRSSSSPSPMPRTDISASMRPPRITMARSQMRRTAVEVVGGEQHRPAIPGVFAHELGHSVHRGGIKPEHRLVQDPELGSVDETAHHADLLFHAVGIAADEALYPVAQPETFLQLDEALLAHLLGHAVDVRHERDTQRSTGRTPHDRP